MRNASIEMPTNSSTASPVKRNSIISAAATRKARRAMARRCAALIPWVSAMKTGASPGGSMMMKRVVKAVIRAGSSVIGRYRSGDVPSAQVVSPPAGVFLAR